MKKIINIMANSIKDKLVEARYYNNNDSISAVSIVALCYNHAAYLPSFFESILSQKVNFKIEIIINDDCSTDNSREIIEKYHSMYPNIVKPIYQNKNMYIQNRKKIYLDIFNLINGEYVSFCESDDLFYNDKKLYLQKRIMDKHKDIGICIHKVKVVHHPNKNSKSFMPNRHFRSGIYNADIFVNEICYKHMIHTSSFFFRKESFSNFITKAEHLFLLVNFDDITIFLIALVSDRIYFINKTLTIYNHCLPNSWTSKFKQKTKKEIIDYNNTLIAYYMFVENLLQNRYDCVFKKCINRCKMICMLNELNYKGIFEQKDILVELKKYNYIEYLKLKIRVKNPKLYKVINCIRKRERDFKNE